MGFCMGVSKLCIAPAHIYQQSIEIRAYIVYIRIFRLIMVTSRHSNSKIAILYVSDYLVADYVSTSVFNTYWRIHIRLWNLLRLQLLD